MCLRNAIFVCHAGSASNLIIIAKLRAILSGRIRLVARLVHLALLIVDGVDTCQLIDLTFHQEIEEVTGAGVVCHHAVQVHCPEQGVRAGDLPRAGLRSGIWESHKVNGAMPEDSLLVEDVTDGLADSHHVHIRQRFLREEATCVDMLSRCKLVHRSHNSCITIRLDNKRDRGCCHLVR